MTDRSELIIGSLEVVGTHLEFRRRWGCEGNLDFTDLGDDTDQSLEVGRAAQGRLTPRRQSGCEG